MPDWMLSGKGGLRECRGCGSDEEPCGLEDESSCEDRECLSRYTSEVFK